MPIFFRRQGNVVYFGCYALILISALISILNSWSHVNFIMIKKNNRNELILPYRKVPFNIVSKTLSKKLLKSNEKLTKVSNMLQSIMIFQMYLAQTIPLTITEIYKTLKTNERNKKENK